MSIKFITADDLRQMEGKEALILLGCGGDLNEWVDGINDLFTKEGILLEGTKFQNVCSFEHEGLTCLLYPSGETRREETRCQGCHTAPQGSSAYRAERASG